MLASVMLTSTILVDTHRDTPLTSQERPAEDRAGVVVHIDLAGRCADFNSRAFARKPKAIVLGFADSEQPLPVVRPAFDVGAP